MDGMAQDPSVLSPAEQIDYAKKVFETVAIDDQQRLKRGLQLREEMHAAIERGEDPKGYRVDWLQRTTSRVMQAITGSAEEFNALYHDDRISVADFADVLESVAHALGLHSVEDEDEPDDDEMEVVAIGTGTGDGGDDGEGGAG
jgi:hypothetical protein